MAGNDFFKAHFLCWLWSGKNVLHLINLRNNNLVLKPPFNNTLHTLTLPVVSQNKSFLSFPFLIISEVFHNALSKKTKENVWSH